MYIILESLYDKFKILISFIFETLTCRTPPEYEKLPDEPNFNF